MRVPLSQVADMATYIAKNKIRPKPEWQKNLAVAETGDFATSLDMEAFNQARCSQMEDHREAVQAFLDVIELAVGIPTG